MKATTGWLFDRLGLAPVTRFLEEHRVPGALAGRAGWMYVFGFATLAAFLIQVITGVALATIYVPSAGFAHETLVFINQEVPLGGFLRAMHFFGASAMVVLILLHAARVFLTGSYKYPREMNWITGVLLLVLTMGMAFTGQLLRWDQDGLWTVVVAARFAARVPLAGDYLAELVLAGATVGGATLSRFYALHVFILPALIIALIGVHVYLLVYHGISEPPEAGRPVDPSTYRQQYQEMKEREGIPYFPYNTSREMIFAFGVVVVIAALAWLVGPRGPGDPPDPTLVIADPRPDWFLRWYYALLWIKPRGLESLAMVYAPLLVLLLLLLFPVFFNRGERSLKRRPWAPFILAAVTITLGTLTVIGLRVPWSPAYETEPLGPAELAVTEGPVLEGARLFHERGCQYCHMVLGEGGRYGPELTRVSLRLSPQEITVRTIQGIGDMPAYHGILSAEEVQAMLAFLRALPERAEALQEGR